MIFYFYLSNFIYLFYFRAFVISECSSLNKYTHLGFRNHCDSGLSMATEPKAATDDVKIDLFEDDDEFEEFEIDEGKS